ncbi:glycogen/starch synthase [Haloferula sp. BvORR071]|uniref:glycogen synthase n=1 Tax=Haloferula sp. BvORR071 TaxID=1396141 RepID=UPI0009465E80|nr:glycogen/starch synthase [Haloferula sp. BvORR071]
MIAKVAHLSSPEVHSPERRERQHRLRRPRILIVTPELNGSGYLGRNGIPGPRAKAGGLADISTLLVDELSARGIDVRVAMPHFRSLFPDAPMSRRLYLCKDREFFYRRSVYDGSQEANRRAALAFQRDVIQNILPAVKPDIVHCHDWMTGLVPAAAKAMGIKSLFTVHNLHDEITTMAEAEDRGIDAARFWQNLHFGHYPHSYEESRNSNPVSMMASAMNAADHVNTVSPSFLQEMMDGRHVAGWGLCDVLRGKSHCGAASGILNAPDPSCAPEHDLRIAQCYGAEDHRAGKLANKLQLQRMLGLEEDASAPMLFWPSRLDPTQKGCGLLAHILYQVVNDYSSLGLQVVFVADGPFKPHFEHIVNFHGLQKRVAVCGFEESLSRQAYAASDFVLVPSAYEPCGLAQMVALKYGSLPIVHRTGGLQDTVLHLDAANQRGNGFVFETHDCGGLRWAIDEAVRFFIRPEQEREREIARIMRQSSEAFSPQHTAEAYIKLYEELSGRIIGDARVEAVPGFRPVAKPQLVHIEAA